MIRVIFPVLLSIMFIGVASADKHAGFDFKSVKNTCQGDHESQDCQKKLNEANEYCKSNKDDKHCEKLHKKMHLRSKMHQCRNNPDSEQCKKFKAKMEQRCKDKPESKPCKKYQAAMVCKDHPESEKCKAAKQKVQYHKGLNDHKDQYDHEDHEVHLYTYS